MQTTNETALKKRMLFSWADLFTRQLKEGEPYSSLMPVVSIWLLDQNTLGNAPAFHHRFKVADVVNGVGLTDRLEIHTIELEKWRKATAARRTPKPARGPPARTVAP